MVLVGAFSIRLACFLPMGIPHSLATVAAGNKVSRDGLRTDVEKRTHPLLGAKVEGSLDEERAASSRVAFFAVGTIKTLKPLP